MKLHRRRLARATAFTLVELMVGLSIAGLILGAMIVGFGTFQQVFAGTDDYYQATSDQMRVLDFIAQDMRSAIPVAGSIGSVSTSGQTLTLYLPDYLDNSPSPRSPAITPLGAVTYGSGNATVVYTITAVSPDHDQKITRTYTPASGSATVTDLTQTAADFQFTCLNPGPPLSNADFSFGGPGQPSSVVVKITFMPKFNRYGFTDARTGTATTANIVLRNHL